MARRDDDVIVDDEGFGYKDRGGEIWEVGESAQTDAAKKKKRKLNVSPTHASFDPVDDLLRPMMVKQVPVAFSWIGTALLVCR